MTQHTMVTISGPRGEKWEKLLGTRSFRVLSPVTVQCTLPGFDSPQPCYMLDVAALTAAQQRKLAAGLAGKFQQPADEVLAEIRARGVPILADNCAVCQFDLRMAI